MLLYMSLPGIALKTTMGGLQLSKFWGKWCKSVWLLTAAWMQFRLCTFLHVFASLHYLVFIPNSTILELTGILAHFHSARCLPMGRSWTASRRWLTWWDPVFAAEIPTVRLESLTMSSKWLSKWRPDAAIGTGTSNLTSLFGHAWIRKSWRMSTDHVVASENYCVLSTCAMCRWLVGSIFMKLHQFHFQMTTQV